MTRVAREGIPQAMIITKILTTAEEVSALRPAWAALLAENPAANRPFFSWEWFEASVHAFAGEASRYVIVLEEHGQTIGILPLLRRKTRQYGMALYELTFCPNFNTPRNDLLVSASPHEGAASRAVWDALLADQGAWHVLRLDNLPCDSPLSNLLVETEAAGTGLVIRSAGLRSPCVGIGDFESFDDYFMATVKKHHRTNLRRHLKRLDETGQGWTVDCFDTPDNIARGLEEVFQVRRTSWKGAPAEDFVRFFQEISPSLADRREILIAVLRIGGRPVAAQYFVCKEGEYYLILNDHDHQCRDTLAPGTNLLTLVLQQAFERHWKVLDFSGDDYEYKTRLATSMRSHYCFQVFNSGLMSRTAYFGKTRVLPLVRKMFRKNKHQSVAAGGE